MEIELKLLADPADLAALPEHPLLQPLRQGPVVRQQLHTLYYDTPSRDLAQAGIALRLRRSGQSWIQTLKGGGRSAGGLHERLEVDWPRPDASLDPALLANTPYAAVFADPRVCATLQPVFETEFERTAITLQFPDGTMAELALDRGEVRAGARSAPISEIEIELMQGSTAALFDFALTLNEALPLRIGTASKAERGNALATGRSGSPQPAAPVVLRREMPVVEALRQLAMAGMTQLQANEDGFLQGNSDSASYGAHLHDAVCRLRSTLRLLLTLASDSEVAADLAELRWLEAALRPLALGSSDEEADPGQPADATGENAALSDSSDNARAALCTSRYTRLLLRLGRRFSRADLGLSDIAINGPLYGPVNGWAQAALEDAVRRAQGDDEERQYLAHLIAFFAALCPEQLGEDALCRALAAAHSRLAAATNQAAGHGGKPSSSS